jgi:hypothetical protein
MTGIQSFIDNPERDLPIHEVFTDDMFAELRSELESVGIGVANLAALEEKQMMANEAHCHSQKLPPPPLPRQICPFVMTGRSFIIELAGRGLPAKDSNGFLDPYFIAYLVTPSGKRIRLD